MEKQEEVEKIIKSHVIWAMGGGLIPIPILDIAAVTAVQIDMMKQLAKYYHVDFSVSAGKAYLSAVIGPSLASIGAGQLAKLIPGIGSLVGGATMSVLSGASTYAVGHVLTAHFENNGTFENIDFDTAKKAYDEAFKKGKSVVEDLKDQEDEAADVYQQLEKLGKLRDKGVISDEEFEKKKQDLLDRL